MYNSIQCIKYQIKWDNKCNNITINNIHKLIINYIVNNLWHKTKVLCNYRCNFKLFNNKCNYNNNLLHNKFNFIVNKCINKFIIK